MLRHGGHDVGAQQHVGKVVHPEHEAEGACPLQGAHRAQPLLVEGEVFVDLLLLGGHLAGLLRDPLLEHRDPLVERVDLLDRRVDLPVDLLLDDDLLLFLGSGRVDLLLHGVVLLLQLLVFAVEAVEHVLEVVLVLVVIVLVFLVVVRVHQDRHGRRHDHDGHKQRHHPCKDAFALFAHIQAPLPPSAAAEVILSGICLQRTCCRTRRSRCLRPRTRRAARARPPQRGSCSDRPTG